MLEDDLNSLFAGAGYRGSVSVLDIDGPDRVELQAQEQAYAASTFKVAVGLELMCQSANGEVELAEPVRLLPDERTYGGQGLCLFTHPAEVSLRDLSVLMLTISDNTATDAVIRRVDPRRINTRMAELGLVRTDFACTISEHFAAMGRALGFADLAAFNRALAAAPPADAVRMDREFREVFTKPDMAPYTTAGEMAQLIRLVWRDEAGPASACANLRAILGSQRLTRKIATGFDANVSVASKSGTVHGLISNDMGAVIYPDGRRFAVAVFTQALAPDADPDESTRLIGTAARIAVEHLRDTSA